MARNQIVKAYLTVEELQKIEQRAGTSGLSISSWARMVLLRAAEGAHTPPRPTTKKETKRNG